MKRYVAYYKSTNGNLVRITSTLAADEIEAQDFFTCRLHRPGRFDLWRMWLRDGKIVKED